MPEPTPEQRVEDLAYLITAHRFRERGLRGLIGEPDLAVARPMAEFLVKEGWRPPVSVPEDLTEAIERLRLWIGPDGPGYYYPTTGGELESDLRTVLAAAEVPARPVPDTEDDTERCPGCVSGEAHMCGPVPDTEDDAEPGNGSGEWADYARVVLEQVRINGESAIDFLDRIAPLSRRPVPSQTPEITDAQIEAAARAIAAEQGVRFGPALSDTWLLLARAALVAAARVGTTPEHTDHTDGSES